MSLMKRFFIEEDGQDMVEYGLVVAGLVVAGATAFAAYTGKLSTAMSAVGDAVSTAL